MMVLYLLPLPLLGWILFQPQRYRLNPDLLQLLPLPATPANLLLLGTLLTSPLILAWFLNRFWFRVGLFPLGVYPPLFWWLALAEGWYNPPGRDALFPPPFSESLTIHRSPSELARYAQSWLEKQPTESASPVWVQSWVDGAVQDAGHSLDQLMQNLDRVGECIQLVGQIAESSPPSSPLSLPFLGWAGLFAWALVRTNPLFFPCFLASTGLALTAAAFSLEFLSPLLGSFPWENWFSVPSHQPPSVPADQYRFPTPPLPRSGGGPSAPQSP